MPALPATALSVRSSLTYHPEGAPMPYRSSLLRRSGFCVRQHPVEGRAVVEAAVGHDGADLRRVVDVGERVRVQEDEVGEPAFLDGAQLFLSTEKPCRIARRRLE